MKNGKKKKSLEERIVSSANAALVNHKYICPPAGNAKLTRCVKKYSSRFSVVVKFSRARKRYERQGILSDKEAVDMAESECKTELKQ